jgi:amidohydrolase
MASTSILSEILADYEGFQVAQEAFYKDLHEHPELSHAEHRTAQCVAAQLQESGFTVHGGIGGTGVVGVLANGDGPTVLLRCELDALPVREDTGVPYASTATVRDTNGDDVPVAHACGHDMHMSCMVGMAKLMAGHRDRWHGTLIPLFQPAEETADGAQGMVNDDLLQRVPAPDVALAQHLLPGIAGTVGTRPGPFMAATDAMKVTVYGRGGHGSMPQHTIDPVVLAAMIIVRLQTIVSREVAPDDTAVLTVGSVESGTRSTIIPDHAVLQLNMRSYSKPSRERMLDAIHRIVRAECQASGSAKDAEFETLFTFPVTENDTATTDRVAKAFADQFGDNAIEARRQTVSEDFSIIPDAAGVPYTYWSIGFTDRKTYLDAADNGHLDDLPTNHSPKYLPPLQPTLRTGTEALTAAALAWLASLQRTGGFTPRAEMFEPSSTCWARSTLADSTLQNCHFRNCCGSASMDHPGWQRHPDGCRFALAWEPRGGSRAGRSRRSASCIVPHRVLCFAWCPPP